MSRYLDVYQTAFLRLRKILIDAVKKYFVVDEIFCANSEKGEYLRDCYSMMSELIEKRLNSRFPTGQTFAEHNVQEIRKFYKDSRLETKNMYT